MFEEDWEEETTPIFNSDDFDLDRSDSMSVPMTSEQVDIENTKSLLSEFLDDKDDIFIYILLSYTFIVFPISKTFIPNKLYCPNSLINGLILRWFSSKLVL